VIAFSRPFWPLFLHVLGAMTLFGAILAASITSTVSWRAPGSTILRRATFRALLVAIPAYILLRGAAQWIYNDEKGAYPGSDPTWIGFGFAVSDAGLLLLLLTLGCAFWWQRSGKPIAGRIVAGLSGVYLVLLAIAWLAMSGKWG
jgi:hypothetical protein